MKRVKWICQCCGIENENTYLCKKCGFDEQKNYRRYGSLVRLNLGQKEAYSKDWALRSTWYKNPVIGMDLDTDRIVMAVIMNEKANIISEQHLSCVLSFDEIEPLVYWLSKEKKKAERWLGMKVTDVVLSLPARLNVCERSLIFKAMKRVGWNVKNVGYAAGFAKMDELFRFKTKKSKTIVCCVGQYNFEAALYEAEYDILEERLVRGETYRKLTKGKIIELMPIHTAELMNEIFEQLHDLMSRKDISHIFLCGESSVISVLAGKIKKLTGKIKIIGMSRNCIAKGAAVYAGVLAKRVMFTQLYLKSTVHDIRVRVWNQDVVLLERDSTLPCHIEKKFKKKFEKNESVFADIEVRQGNYTIFEENKLIAETKLSSLTLTRQGERIDTGEAVYGCQIEICAEVDCVCANDADEIHLAVKDLVNQKIHTLTIVS